jgi:hypothetical protein
MRLFSRDDERLDMPRWRFRLPRPSRALRPLLAAALVCLAALVLFSTNGNDEKPAVEKPRTTVPKGMVGVTVEVTSASLAIGDRIDVLATTTTTATVAEAALVLAIRGNQVFVAVPKEAAERIAAIPADARITVTVRSP